MMVMDFRLNRMEGVGKIKIQSFFSYDLNLEILNDIVSILLDKDDQIVYCTEEYIPPQYMNEVLKDNELYQIFIDKYNNLWKIINNKDELIDRFKSDFLVDLRIINKFKVNEWKYEIQIVEDIEDTNLEITANNDYEIPDELINEILKRYR